MLAKIPWSKFVRWQAFDEIDPIGGLRHDYLTASIVAMMANLRRDHEKHPDPIPLATFLLQWGKKAKKLLDANPKPKGKSWQELKLIGQMMAAMYNAAEDDYNRKKQRRKKR